MVAPLGQQPIQNPIGTPPVVRSQPPVTPTTTTPTTTPAAVAPATLPNQTSQNTTTARQTAGFSNSVSFPGVISAPGKENSNSMVQRMTRMLESMLNHPPQPSLLEPIGKNFRDLTDKLLEKLDSERQETAAAASDSNAAPAAADAPTGESAASEAPTAEEPAAEAPTAEGPAEANSSEADEPETAEAEATGDTTAEAAESDTETESAEAEATGDSAAEAAEGAEAAENDSEAESAEAESTTGPAAAGSSEGSPEPAGGGQDFAPTPDTRTQGDPNAIKHFEAIMSTRYADLFQRLIGEQAYQNLQEMLGKYRD